MEWNVKKKKGKKERWRGEKEKKKNGQRGRTRPDRPCFAGWALVPCVQPQGCPSVCHASHAVLSRFLFVPFCLRVVAQRVSLLLSPSPFFFSPPPLSPWCTRRILSFFFFFSNLFSSSFTPTFFTSSGDPRPWAASRLAEAESKIPDQTYFVCCYYYCCCRLCCNYSRCCPQSPPEGQYRAVQDSRSRPLGEVPILIVRSNLLPLILSIPRLPDYHLASN